MKNKTNAKTLKNYISFTSKSTWLLKGLKRLGISEKDYDDFPIDKKDKIKEYLEEIGFYG